jgi:protein-S-isoprenylcysteine O-methyltransferase Ste14
VTSGPYHYIRHPQYNGIFLALFGQLIHWPTLPTLVLFPIIIWVYYRLARKEERDMITRFGDEYAVYKGKTPMFFPRAGQWRQIIEGGEDTTGVLPY